MSLDAAVESRVLLLAAVDLTFDSLRFAGRFLLTLPTPCSEWQLGQLVYHVADSASVLTQIIAGVATVPTSATGCTLARMSLTGLRRVIGHAPAHDPAVDVAVLTGAFELTIHAWDIDISTGAPARPLPDDQVGTLVRLAPIVLGTVDRDGLFGPSLPPPSSCANDTERLLALFGRRGG